MLIENSNDEVTTNVLPIVNTVLNDAVFRPMLFSTPMVQALLDGRKTQTRRLIKSKHESGLFKVCKNRDGVLTRIESIDYDERNCEKDILPVANIGDIIWVREAHVSNYNADTHTDGYIYKASYNENAIRWTPSLFMKKDACRLWLKVTNVKIERLQDISENDAISEGIDTCFNKYSQYYKKDDYKNYTWHGEGGDDSFSGYSNTDNAKESFQSLWYKINCKDSWNKNPWVFVYEFEVTTERPYGFI